MLKPQKLITKYKYTAKEGAQSTDDYEKSEYGQETIKTKSEIGLANYEQDHDSQQKDALIDRIKTLRKIKSDSGGGFSPVQQLQLEVAERLLGSQAIAVEFDYKENTTESITSQKEAPTYTKYNLEARDNRRASKLHSISRENNNYTYSPNRIHDINKVDRIPNKNLSVHGISNAAGKGFVLNPSRSPEQADNQIQKDTDKNIERLASSDSEISSINKLITETKSNIKQNESTIIEIENKIQTLNNEKSKIKDGFFNKGKNSELRSQIDNQISSLNSDKARLEGAKTNNEDRVKRIEIQKENRLKLIRIATEVQKNLVNIGDSKANHYDIKQMILAAGSSNEQLEAIQVMIYDKKTGNLQEPNPKYTLNRSSFDKNDFVAKKAFEEAAVN